MNNLKKYILIVFLLSAGVVSNAQYARTIDTLMSIGLIQANYAFDVPGGDLAERFGFNHELGAGFFYKMKKGWIFGVEGGFIFGNQVRGDTSVIDPLQTSNGFLIGKVNEQEGYHPNFELSERGYKIPQFKVGKVFHKPILQGSGNSGFFVMVGAGFMQYKVKITDADRSINPIKGDYIKGYDHLTNGLTTSQSIGYLYLDRHKLLNLSLSFEFTQGYTQNRRDWNADSQSPENESRLDLMYGFKLSWYLPLYPKLASGYYFY